MNAILGKIFFLGKRPADAEPLPRRALNDQGGNPFLLGSLAECLLRSVLLAEYRITPEKRSDRPLNGVSSDASPKAKYR